MTWTKVSCGGGKGGEILGEKGEGGVWKVGVERKGK